MQAPWQPLLDWWFGDAAAAPEIAAEKQRLWFGYRPEQDEQARQRFGELTERALAGGLQEWSETPAGWLALILLLDQLPRMIHRGTPRAFAGDERAQQLVRDGLAQGGDVFLAPIQRVFVYLVLEHAEQLPAQEQAVAYFRQLCDLAGEPSGRCSKASSTMRNVIAM